MFGWFQSYMQFQRYRHILVPHFPGKRDSSVHIFGLVVCSSLWSWYSLVIHSKYNFIFKCLPLYSFQCWYILTYIFFILIHVCSRKLRLHPLRTPINGAAPPVKYLCTIYLTINFFSHFHGLIPNINYEHLESFTMLGMQSQLRRNQMTSVL